jgi:hypothetical protein
LRSFLVRNWCGTHMQGHYIMRSHCWYLLKVGPNETTNFGGRRSRLVSH